MSILQEYEEIRRRIGGEKYAAINEYLEINKELFLSDLYYKPEQWEKFEAWYGQK